MSGSPSVQQRNREVVDRLIAETLRDPAHPYRGKFVAVIDGQVAVVAGSETELAARLEQMGADRENCLCFEAGLDYDEVQVLPSGVLERSTGSSTFVNGVDSNSVLARNQALADRINAEVLSDPSHPYRGKWVGLANGQLIAVADDPDPLIDQLQQIEPESMNCFCFEAGLDYSQVEHLSSPF